MYVKALTIEAPDLACSVEPSALAVARTGLAGDDALLDLAVELLIRRGHFSDSAAANLVARVRRGQALARWRGQVPGFGSS